MDSLKSYKWANRFKISEKNLQEWKKSESQKSFLMWSLQQKLVDRNQYFKWASRVYHLPVLKSDFFQCYLISKESWQEVKPLKDWNEELMPVWIWEGTIFVACLEPPKDHDSWDFPHCLTLVTDISLRMYWQIITDLEQSTYSLSSQAIAKLETHASEKELNKTKTAVAAVAVAKTAVAVETAAETAEGENDIETLVPAESNNVEAKASFPEEPFIPVINPFFTPLEMPRELHESDENLQLVVSDEVSASEDKKDEVVRPLELGLTASDEATKPEVKEVKKDEIVKPLELGLVGSDEATKPEVKEVKKDEAQPVIYAEATNTKVKTPGLELTASDEATKPEVKEVKKDEAQPVIYAEATNTKVKTPNLGLVGSDEATKPEVKKDEEVKKPVPLNYANDQDRHPEIATTSITLVRPQVEPDFNQLFIETKKYFSSVYILENKNKNLYMLKCFGSNTLVDTNKPLISLDDFSIFRVLSKGYPYHGFVAENATNKKFFSSIGWKDYPKHASAISIKTSKTDVNFVFLGLSLFSVNKADIQVLDQKVKSLFETILQEELAQINSFKKAA